MQSFAGNRASDENVHWDPCQSLQIERQQLYGGRQESPVTGRSLRQGFVVYESHWAPNFAL